MNKRTIVLAVLGGVGLQLAPAAEDAQAVRLYQEPLRPQLHFTPPTQWMNDPNGMVYVDGEYHLFYQYHPYSNVWGPMHWGHAVSRDLVHWQHLPIALYPDSHGAIFSGSVVYDRTNTSGLGSRGNGPLIAIFTYHNHQLESRGSDAFQVEGMAYSVDKGRTWEKYAGNPVLDNPGIRDFRDPKVSWYEAGRKWIMTLAVSDHVSFYSSKDLKHWTHESDFGREWGAHDGVWECPDLIKMQVEGEHMSRYVLLVSGNPGGPNGGSATQYFVGSFDGHVFGIDPDLQERLKLQAAQLPDDTLFEDFHDGLAHWTATGKAFKVDTDRSGTAYLESYSAGEAATGVLRSRLFRIDRPYINFKIGGGRYPGLLGMQLLVDGEVVRSATGDDGNTRQQLGSAHGHDTSARNASWDVRSLIGKYAQLEVIDGVAADHGYVIIGRIAFADNPGHPQQVNALWVDYGADDYAGVTWSGVPQADGRRLYLGWMNNWAYGQVIPTERWRGAMTLPRELRLVRTARGLEIHSAPVRELAQLRMRSEPLAATSFMNEVSLVSPALAKGGLLELEANLDANDAGLITLKVGNAVGETVTFRINRTDRRYELDRSQSGSVDFSHAFTRLQTAPMPSTDDHLSLHVFLDHSSLEIFINGGETVFTDLVFPHYAYDMISLSADRNVDLRSGAVYELQSIWPQPK